MTCDEYIDRIHGFVDGELGGMAVEELFGHLAGCKSCRSYLKFVVSVGRITREEITPFPSDLDGAVIARIHPAGAERSELIGGRRVTFWRKPLTVSLPVAVAAAAVIIIVGLLLGRGLRTPDAQTQNPYASMRHNGDATAVIVIYGIPPVEVVGKLRTNNVEEHLPIQQ